MVRFVNTMLCLLLPWRAAVAADDVAALIQVRASGAALTVKGQGTFNAEALRSALAMAHADLKHRIAESRPQKIVPAQKGKYDLQKTMLSAIQYSKSDLNITKATRRAEKCGVACVMGIVLDVMAIVWEGSAGFSETIQEKYTCPVAVLSMWWVMGILVEMTDHNLPFPEAMHMLTQQFTSVGYGSSTPMDPAGLKIWHGLHGVLSQMSVNRVMTEVVNFGLEAITDAGLSLIGSKKKADDAATLAVVCITALAAHWFWFATDLHLGDKATYPAWFDAVIDGLYQALITMTTIGYGDLSLTKDVSKMASPAISILTNAFANLANKLAPGGKGPEPPKALQDLEIFKCSLASSAMNKLEEQRDVKSSSIAAADDEVAAASGEEPAEASASDADNGETVG